MSLLTLRLMGKMLSLEVSMKNISGPLSIAEFAGRSAQLGIVTFISFLALVSISLGVLNLLPVPMLDGGHLLFYLIEWLKGSPLDDNAQSLLQRVGLTLILMLMSVALVNDVGRLLG
jgi:regulator of sigma E protease